MEGESSCEESRFMNGDGTVRRGPPPLGGGRNSNNTAGFRGGRGGSRGGASFTNNGSRPPLLPLLQHPPDWRAQEKGPGPRGNFRQVGDMYRNQFRGGQFPHPNMNMNHHPGNMYGGGRNNNYNHGHNNSNQQQYNMGGPHYNNNNNSNYPPRGSSWRETMEEGRGRGPPQQECHKQYDPDVIRLLEEEGIYQLKRRSLKFKDANFFCRLCDFHCDEPQHCVQHMKSNRHQKLATVREFDSYLQSLPHPSPSMIEAVDAAVLGVSEQHGITDEERQQRFAAVAHLAAMLAKSAPEAKLELTGSTFSGLALKTSDVNVGLFMPDNQSPYKSIMALKAIIEECPENEDVSNDLRSSFPSLSYTASRHGGCRVVVGVGTPSVRAMARLMAAFAALDDRFVVLARALRYWAQLCDVSDQRSGSLPAVAYAVMVVHFLQQVSPPVLPTLRQLSPSAYKTEDFPLPKDIKNNFSTENTMSAGDLWLRMLNYYGHHFKFINYNVNVTQTTPSERNDKTYSKKMSIEDPFNPKRNLTRTISNTAVLEYIIDRLFKVICRYFSVPQLSFGQLFYTLTVGKTIMKEKRSKNNSLTDSMDKNSAESEVDKSNSSDLDLALERLAVKETSMDSQDDEETRHITSGDQLTRPFDTISFDEAVRIINLIEKKHFDFKFDKQKFTEGESVPIFCSMCQHEGHIREECEEEKLPELLPLKEVDSKHYKFLSGVLCSLREEMEPTRKEIMMREEVVQSLQFYIRKDQKYSDAHLQLFGSSANGFGFTNSDLDVCITFEAERLKEQLDQDFLIYDLVRILRQSREFQDVLAIATAKVPIVKFRCIKTNLEGDLSLYNTLALHNTNLLRNYSKIDPRVKILGYGLKYFAKRCDIGDASRGSLSSYAFTLLLIHFLQQCQPPVVPVLQKLYEPSKPPTPVMVEGWNTWFYSDLDNLHKAWLEMGANKMSVGELWVEMFRYYTETFDFDEHVVNIRQKEPMLRLEKLWNNHSVAIEDPFDLNHNLGGALSRKMNTFIRKALINGRHMYGGLITLPQSPEAATKFLFDPAQLTAGAPPNDRGCRKCRKIGHLVKDCPQRPADGVGKKKQQQQQQQPQQGKVAGGNTPTQDSPATRGAAPVERRRATEQRQAAAGNAPPKKKDAKAFLGEKGMLRIAEVLPEGSAVGGDSSRPRPTNTGPPDRSGSVPRGTLPLQHGAGACSRAQLFGSGTTVRPGSEEQIRKHCALYTRSRTDASPHKTQPRANTSPQHSHSRADTGPQHSRADTGPHYSQQSRAGPVNGRPLISSSQSSSSQSRLQAALGAPSSPNRSCSRGSSEAGNCGASQSGSQQHSSAVRSPRDQHYPPTDRSPTHKPSASNVTHQYSSSARNIPSDHISSSKNHLSLFPSGQLSPMLKDRSTGGECALKDTRTRLSKVTGESSTAAAGSSGASLTAASGDAKSDGKSINMTQLFSIANECGGSVSLGKLSELPQVQSLYHESSPDEGSHSTSDSQEQQPLVLETSADTTIVEESIDLIDTINKQEMEEAALISEPSTNEYFGNLHIGTGVEPPPGFNQFPGRTRSEIFPQKYDLLDMPLNSDNTGSFPALSSTSMNGGFQAMTTSSLASSTGYSGSYGYNSTSSVPFSSSSFCLEPQVTAVSSSDSSFLSSSVTSRLLPNSFSAISSSLSLGGGAAAHSYAQFPMVSSSGLNNHISSPNEPSHQPSPPIMGLNGPMPPFSGAVTTSLSSTSSHLHLTSPPPPVQMGTPFSSAGGLHHPYHSGPRLINTVVAPTPGLLPPQTMSPAVQLAPQQQLSGYQIGGPSLPASSGGGSSMAGLYSTSVGYSTASDGGQYGASSDPFGGNTGARIGLGMGQLSKQSSVDSSVGGLQQALRHPGSAMLPHHHQFATLAAPADGVPSGAHLQQPPQMIQALPQLQYQQLNHQHMQQLQLQQLAQYQLLSPMQLQQMTMRQPQQISLQQAGLQLTGMQQQQTLQQSNIRHQQTQQGSVFVPTSFSQTQQPQQMDLQQLMSQQQQPLYFINGSADMDPNQFFAAS